MSITMRCVVRQREDGMHVEVGVEFVLNPPWRAASYGFLSRMSS